jgi:hypothetical protein
VLKHGGPPADGGCPGGRRAGGHPGGQRTGGALCYGWEYMLTPWEKGGCGRSPNVEAGKMYQHFRRQGGGCMVGGGVGDRGPGGGWVGNPSVRKRGTCGSLKSSLGRIFCERPTPQGRVRPAARPGLGWASRERTGGLLVCGIAPRAKKHLKLSDVDSPRTVPGMHACSKTKPSALLGVARGPRQHISHLFKAPPLPPPPPLLLVTGPAARGRQLLMQRSFP